MQAVILAAGKGSRLQPLTFERSKAMMPIAGKPMLARVMEMLQAAGLDEFIIVAHPDDRELYDVFSPLPNVKIVWQAERKGAAHALSYAAPHIKSDFVLSACDNLVEHAEAARFVQHFRADPDHTPAGLLALIRVPKEKMSSMGMVVWDGVKIQKIVEKPAPEAVISNIVSMPLYCFSRRFLELLPLIQPSRRGEIELQDAMQMLIDESGDLQGEMLSGRRTVTDASDLLELNLHFLAREAAALPESFPASTHFHLPCLVEPGVEIAADCQIGPNVLLETGSKIGQGAILRNTLILRGAVVPAGEIVENNIFA
jgi:glucose-1-phosphate thymidylyltransferase